MAINIVKDALFYRSGTENSAVWKPLDIAKGEDGESIYQTWLVKNNRTDSPESWQLFLDEFRNMWGASRVTKVGDQYIAYTPILANGQVEPPTSASTFNGTTAITLPIEGAEYQEVSMGDEHYLIFGDNPEAGSPFTEAGFATGITYKPAVGLYVGNRTGLPNYSFNTTVTPAAYGEPQEQGLIIGSFLGNRTTSTVAVGNGSTSSYKDIYSSPRDIHAIGIDKTYGDLLIGSTSTGSTPLGQTIICAGAASFTGERVNMGSTAAPAANGKQVTTAYNGILARRKVGSNKSWSKNAQDYMMLDSGHIEWIRLTINTKVTSGSNRTFTTWQAGKTYTYTYKLKNSYYELPHSSISIVNWVAGNGQKNWHDYLNVNTIIDNSGEKTQMRVQVSVKKVPTLLTIQPHIDILICSADSDTPFENSMLMSTAVTSSI